MSALRKFLLALLTLLLIVIGLLALFPEAATRLAIDAERSASGLEHMTTEVNGETWHYLQGGSHDAETILLLHGFGGDKDNWTRFSKFLTGRYRVLAPDLPGFGESARHPDWDYSLPSQRDRLAAFVQTLELAPFHLAGNSMGGQLAALYTLQHPEQVLSLGLFDNAGVDAPRQSEMQRALAQGKMPLILESVDDFDDLLAFVSHQTPFIPWPVKGVLAQRALDHAAFNRQIFQDYKGDRSAGLEPLLAGIRQPVLILWGALDRVLDVSSIEVMRPLLPQAEVVIMAETGHVPMLERPQETADIYLDFVQNHPQSE